MTSRICIIGGGFSAYCLSRKYPDAEIITCTHAPQNMTPRPHMQVNKRLNRFCPSAGRATYDLPTGKLHDRLGLGGNSGIWGGFIDTASPQTTQAVRSLPDIKLRHFAPRDPIYSPGGTLGLLLDNHNNVFSATEYFTKRGFTEGYVTSLTPASDGVTVHYSNSAGQQLKTRYAKVLLACGVVQTLDLLASSGLLKEGDIIRLSDNSYELRRYPGQTSEPGYWIHFHLLAAAAKFVGFKKDIGNFIQRLGPFCISQRFFNPGLTLALRFSRKDGAPHFAHIEKLSSPLFGGSIHYGSITVNGVTLSSFLSTTPGISAFGTACLPAIAPGPVSNQIIGQVFN